MGIPWPCCGSLLPLLMTLPSPFFGRHLAVCVIPLLFGWALAQGAVYHVSPIGNDTNAGTAESPFREIRKAVTVLTAGDTVIVADGSYKGFDIVGKGAANLDTTIIAPGRNAVITPTTDRGINNPYNIQIWECTRLILDGLRTFNATRAGLRIVYGSHVTVKNGVFGNHENWGIVTSHTDDVVIEANDCYGSRREHGIYVANSGDRPIVRGNRLHDNVASGLRSNGDVIQGGDGIISGALFENNIIYNNGSIGGAGMNLDGLQDGIIRNNLFYNNQATGIALFKGGGAEGPKGMQVLNNTIIVPAAARYNLRITDAIGPILVRNNLLYNATTAKGPYSWNTPTDAAWTDSDYNAFGGGQFVSTDGEATRISMETWRASGHEPNSRPNVMLSNVVVDPASHDYRLKAGSPLIDGGTVLPNVPTDILGTSRPLGTAPDIGAYEYGQYAAWKAAEGFPDEVPNDGDSDKDGIPLLLEYAMGLDPKESSAMQLPKVRLTADRLELDYARLRTDLFHTAEQSPDLVIWTRNGVDQGLPGPSATASVPRALFPKRQFMRLQVTLP